MEVEGPWLSLAPLLTLVVLMKQQTRREGLPSTCPVHRIARQNAGCPVKS